MLAKRKGENFRRIKASTLTKYLGESHNESESIFGLVSQNEFEDKENSDTVSIAGSEVSIADSMTSAVTYTTDMLGITEETKFILLDLRDEEVYKQFHIKEALSFPGPNISRDKVFAQLLRFKNHPDKIIVVYMDDERHGTHYAKLLHEKGFDNIFLLSGAVEKFLEAYPEYIEGNCIPEIKKKVDKKTKK